ncbi:MAG: LOG family protein [Propionibacteriaceae bacterium]
MTRIEIESLQQWDQYLSSHQDLIGVIIQSLDLRDRDLTAINPSHSIFLGCDLTLEQETWLRARHGLIFPDLPQTPINPYRAALYTPQELLLSDDRSYASSLDGRSYAWSTATPAALEHTLITSLHDHAISDALSDHLSQHDPHRIVGVMGGHALERGTSSYREAVELGAKLTSSGYYVVSGGGPGAMEATNLGAMLSKHSSTQRDQACAMLAQAPSFRPSIDQWAAAAFKIKDTFGAGADSLGIPTWFYGHEPPNAFASSIAKYFSNALREDTLLSICRGGLIYLPGAAGTVQELFQAVTGNYYAHDLESIAPLILVGRNQWTSTLPVWDLLTTLGQDRLMASKLQLVDTIDDAWFALTT